MFGSHFFRNTPTYIFLEFFQSFLIDFLNPWTLNTCFSSNLHVLKVCVFGSEDFSEFPETLVVFKNSNGQRDFVSAPLGGAGCLADSRA